MSKPLQLRKGDRLKCTFYSDCPTVVFDGYGRKGQEVWVKEIGVRGKVSWWWGPRSWFRRLPK